MPPLRDTGDFMVGVAVGIHLQEALQVAEMVRAGRDKVSVTDILGLCTYAPLWDLLWVIMGTDNRMDDGCLSYHFMFKEGQQGSWGLGLYSFYKHFTSFLCNRPYT